MAIHRVASLREAVALAESLKAEGTYDLFRGQARDHPPRPSLARILQSRDEARIARARRRLELFERWLGDTPELAYLQEPGREHDFMAVAQHYGIPTYFLDFTTEPAIAGFFAADTKEPPTDQQSCIYLLDSNELRDVWDTLKDVEEREGAFIELVTIDVTNLWRLQAQRGVFVATNYNWEVDFPLDRIVFPYTGYPDAPTPEEIYPIDKSPLEQLLDQHFAVEGATYASEELRAMIEELQRQGKSASWGTWAAFEDGMYAPAFKQPSDVRPLPSWSETRLEAWRTYLDEDYHTTVGAGADVRVELRDPSMIGAEVHNAVVAMLGAGRSGEAEARADGRAAKRSIGPRERAVSWSVEGLPEGLGSDALDELLRLAWNGMRRLPYSDHQLATALGTVARLAAGEVNKGTVIKEHVRFPELFDDGIQLELGYADGSGSRAYVSSRRLGDAMRQDLRALLVPEHQTLADNPRDVFRVLYNPRLLFDFESLQELFVESLIPSQVVLHRKPVLFNPAQLIRLGLP